LREYYKELGFILKRFQVGFTYFLKMINVKRIRDKSKKVKQNLQIKNLFL